MSTIHFQNHGDCRSLLVLVHMIPYRLFSCLNPDAPQIYTFTWAWNIHHVHFPNAYLMISYFSENIWWCVWCMWKTVRASEAYLGACIGWPCWVYCLRALGLALYTAHYTSCAILGRLLCHPVALAMHQYTLYIYKKLTWFKVFAPLTNSVWRVHNKCKVSQQQQFQQHFFFAFLLWLTAANQPARYNRMTADTEDHNTHI